MIIFKEAIGTRLWIAITLITISGILLSVSDFTKLSFSTGSVFVAAACLCWGFENNFTRMLSLKNPVQIVVVKGFGAGASSLAIAFALKQYSNNLVYILITMALGFVAYGLSIFFYIKAQRDLGATRTSSYYAAAPFIGVIISWVFLHEKITFLFLFAFSIMLAGTFFIISEKHKHSHIHVEIAHEHKHNHQDGHHLHHHDTEIIEEHNHEHIHENIAHKHSHTPDMHHKHTH
jgi:drug/metabolite transporter (DMT)-like permease